MSTATSSPSPPSLRSALGTFPLKLGSSCLWACSCSLWLESGTDCYQLLAVHWENWKYLKSQKLVFLWGQSPGAGFGQVTEILLV